MTDRKHRLLLVDLTADQIARAKVENGQRKRITHAVIVPGVGQRFGTLKQCAKYYDAWNQLYPLILERGQKVHGSHIDIDNFRSDGNLSLNLAELYDSRERALSAAERDRLRRQLHGSILSDGHERQPTGCAPILVLVAAAAVLVIL